MKKNYLPIGAVLIMAALTACQANTETTAETKTEAVKNNMIYGTATLTYAEFYSGDVSSVQSYDAVSSATTNKYAILDHMATDFVDEQTNADGYHITGVKNVAVAVAEKDLEAYKLANSSFVQLEGEVPKQYKTVTMDGNIPVYSETVFNIADTVTDATAELLTGTHWGDYQINVTDGAVTHLRNAREGEFDIGSDIQGIILETEDGLKVGMEALQSIWVQPYEVSFNVEGDNSHNTHIAAYDNLPELSKLVGKTVNKITYIMPDAAYVYEFDGIYIKLLYEGEITSRMEEQNIILSQNDFSEFDNAEITVVYTVGSGRDAKKYILADTKLEAGVDTYSLNMEETAAEENKEGVYSAIISSDNFADVIVSVPASAEQLETLSAVLAQAKEKYESDQENRDLEEHIKEAEEMLGQEQVSSSDAGSLINEIEHLIAVQEGH